MKLTRKALVLMVVGIVLILIAQITWAAPKGNAAKTVDKKTLPRSMAKITFEAREYDFGSVEQGEKVKNVFRFSNTGKDPLVIERVQTSCGCTAAITSAKTIQPGQTGTIETTFNSERFYGQVHKTVSVYSNDPDEALIRLTIRGRVVTDVVIVPYRELFFGLVEHNKVASKSFLLTQGGVTPLEVTKAECDLDFITTEIVPGTTGNKKTYQVMLHVGEKAPIGRFEGTVKIHTNLPKHPVIERKVLGVVREIGAKISPRTIRPVPNKANNDGGSSLPPFVDPIPVDKPVKK